MHAETGVTVRTCTTLILQKTPTGAYFCILSPYHLATSGNMVYTVHNSEQGCHLLIIRTH